MRMITDDDRSREAVWIYDAAGPVSHVRYQFINYGTGPWISDLYVPEWTRFITTAR